MLTRVRKQPPSEPKRHTLWTMYPLERRTVSNRPATEVIGHVPQIGWQLRLGEHIFVKSRRDGGSYSCVPGIDAAVVEEISAPSARAWETRLRSRDT